VTPNGAIEEADRVRCVVDRVREDGIVFATNLDGSETSFIWCFRAANGEGMEMNKLATILDTRDDMTTRQVPR